VSITGKDSFCRDSRECFGRLPDKTCRALTGTYEQDGQCPFCKPDREVTDGVRYPYDIRYGKGE